MATVKLDMLVSDSASIWCAISENDFRKHIVALEERTNAVPVDVTVFEPDVSSNRDDSNRLPFRVEQQVADDMAFLVAVQEGAQSVAAACIEQHISPRSLLKVRFAAADAVEQPVQDYMKMVCDVLIQASASYPTQLSEPIDIIFRLIVAQHQYRIFGRLRSTRWDKPKYLERSHKKALWEDFANVIHRVQHVYPSKNERSIRSLVEAQLSILAKQYENFEQIATDSATDQLCALIKATYTFCKHEAVQTFAAELISLRYTTQIAAAVKTLHQLEKIGSYWRIANNLVATAKKFPLIFSKIELEYLSPYASVPTEIAYESWSKSCHVHAEVQLIVYYDLRKQDAATMESFVRPRIIGSSKYLCYLCYLFMNTHGDFFAANTHGRLYDQWTVPDMPEFNGETRHKYANVLAKMDDIVRQETTKQSVWHVEPMTSRQNLLLDKSADVSDIQHLLNAVKI